MFTIAWWLLLTLLINESSIEFHKIVLSPQGKSFKNSIRAPFFTIWNIVECRFFYSTKSWLDPRITSDSESRLALYQWLSCRMQFLLDLKNCVQSNTWNLPINHDTIEAQMCKALKRGLIQNLSNDYCEVPFLWIVLCSIIVSWYHESL